MAWLGASLAACGSTTEVNEEAVRAGEKDVDIQAALAKFKDVRVVGSEAGVPYMVTGKLGRLPAVGSVSAQRAKDELRTTAESVSPVFRVSGEELTFKRASTDARGHQFLRFQQVHNGLEVIGGEMLLHADAEGNVYAANSSLREAQGVASRARVAAEAAQRAAVDGSEALRAEAQGASRLVYFKPDGQGLRLAYEVRVTGERADGLPVDDLVYVSADDGRTLATHSRIHTAQNRAVYTGNNTTSLPGTLKRSEGGAATGDTHIDENYGHLGTTYQCYFQNFGRDSYNNAGAQ
ncbi:MAG TPA: peptidase M4, partial [Archangium sp.]